jgi:hypothetical protein
MIYTVLLLYPDYLASEFGHETYLAHVKTDNVTDAIRLAQKMATMAQYEVGVEPLEIFARDFYVLCVFEGKHNDKKGLAEEK